MGTHRACRGWPEGWACPVLVPLDRMYCSGCREALQEAFAAGLPSDLTPVGVVLEDFDAPKLMCQCGGDPEAPLHERSLLHLKWGYQQGRPAEATPRTFGPYRK